MCRYEMGMDPHAHEVIYLISRLGAMMVCEKAGRMSLCLLSGERRAFHQPDNSHIMMYMGMGHGVSKYLLRTTILGSVEPPPPPLGVGREPLD